MVKEWWALDKKEVFGELKTGEEGLSEHEAKLRLKHFGKNEIRQIGRISPVLIFFEQFKSVFIIILLLAAAFSLFIKHYVDFAVIMAIVLLNSSIGFFQQYKAERIISEMREMLVPKVKVIRDGKLEEINAEELVPGDIVIVNEGDKVMADCRIISANMLETNEAILTGESFPQAKNVVSLKVGTEMANRENILFMGTSIVKGNARAVVVSTGMQTEFGKIAEMAQKVKHERTPLEKKLDEFSRKVAVVILVLAAITISIGLLRGEDWYNMILTGVALAISVIPEGVPAVIAITLAFAIRRMQKQNALVRKLPAGETLGRVTVICVDKTGTLTEEEMFVTDIYCNRDSFVLRNGVIYDDRGRVDLARRGEIKELMKIGVMCNNARLEETHEGIKIFGDPTEKALVYSAYKSGVLKKDETEQERRVIEYSFTSKRKMMSIVRGSSGGYVSYVKGAPDVILRRCEKELFNGRVISLTSRRRSQILIEYEKMASRALRVLAFAYKPIKKVSEDEAESKLIFAGLQGMMDPPRKEVKKAIEDCKTAGIKVKMITGDSELTAIAVGEMISLDGDSIEGKELEKMSDEDFYKAVKEKNIFARITPELKLRIINALKMQGEIVAVTGDGVNDVLALKNAHIGIAMGIRGTDVAREVSDIILLDDNFASIVRAVKEGRRVYDNLKKSIKFHLAANVDEIFVIMFALIFAFPLPLMPLAILWMNLITDSLPSLSLSIEQEEKNIMRRKPRDPGESILEGILGFIITAGVIAFIMTMLVFWLYYDKDLEKARTMALSVSVFCELFLVFTCRSDNRNIWEIGLFSNKMLFFSVLGAGVLQIIAIYTPLSLVFGFKALSMGELGFAVLCSSAGFVFFEVKKAVKNRRK